MKRLWIRRSIVAQVGLCGLGLLFLAVPAFSQRRANERTSADDKAEEAARKAAEEREARVPTVVEEAERKKVETQAAPTLRYEDYRRQVETKMSQKRGEMLQYLDQILDQTDDPVERPSLLFQKAELLLEEKQFYFFQGMAVDDQIADALVNGSDGQVLALQEKKETTLEESRKWLREAVLLFQEIEERYPSFERMPEVLFALGRAFWDANSYKKALESYRKLIRNHPKNQFAADAWLAFGEYYFQMAPDDERDIDKALDAYGNAAKFQDSPVFGYAVYKQGWCFYNKARYEKATEKFKEVILYSDINSDLLGERRIALAREARRDYVLAYAQYGDARGAPAEFKQVAAESELFPMLERLADIFYGNGLDRDAIVLYQMLMKLEPASSRNPLFQGKVVKLASRIGEKRQVVGQVRKLTEEFERVRKQFAGMKEGSEGFASTKENLEEAEDISDNTLRFLATTWHNEAKKTRQDSTFEFAYELYGDYLNLFPEKKEAYEIRFFYAELLYKLERFEPAGEQYLRVFTADPKGKWASAAAEEAVRAYDELIKDFNRSNKETLPTGEDALKERPVPDVKKKYLAACKNYLEHYPSGPIAAEVHYKIARTLYDYNYFSESTPRFMEIIEKFPGGDRAEQAANLVLDTYNLQEDWQALHDAARTFFGVRPMMKNEAFRTQLTTVLEESSFKLISDFEKKEQWAEAGKRYLAFADEFRRSKLADKALANAAAMYTRAGELERAIKVRKRLVKQFPDSALVPDQMYNVATAYEQIVSYKQAAEWLERFVEKSPQDPRARDALFNASIYRQGVGQTQKAIEDREAYLKRYPKAKDAESIAYSIATAWQEAGDSRRAIGAYLAFANEWQRRAPGRALEAYYKAIRMMESDRRYRREYDKHLVNLDKQARRYKSDPPPGAEDPLAFLAFLEADRTFAGFQRQSIAAPDKPNDFRKTLKAKTEGRDGVLAAYTGVVKLRSPEWAVASLFRIGEAHSHLATSIQGVSPPKGLTDEQSQLFRDKLTEQTLPIEDQATQAMLLCLDKSAEFGVFNDWTRKCLNFLEEKRPDQFPKSNLEQVPPLEVKAGIRDPANGYVFDVPAKGERARPEKPGTKPKVDNSGDLPDEGPGDAANQGASS